MQTFQCPVSIRICGERRRTCSSVAVGSPHGTARCIRPPGSVHAERVRRYPTWVARPRHPIPDLTTLDLGLAYRRQHGLR